MAPDRSSHPPAPTRRPYQRPSIERVLLKPEEAVLGSCKATQGLFNGPFGGVCFWLATCRTLGS